MQNFEHFSVALTQKGFGWHQEDACAASTHLPIYAVADGVTLAGFQELMDPSGSRKAADAFCADALKILERAYPKLTEDTFKEAYQAADKTIRSINKTSEVPVSTVAAIVALKDNYVFGSRVTDCGFGIFRGGETVFKTPEYWSWAKWTNRKGYGVLDGKGNAVKFIDFWKKEYRAGDILVLWSDGFENHFDTKEFVDLFGNESFPTLKEKIIAIDKTLVEQDNEKFGKERTLLAVLL